MAALVEGDRLGPYRIIRLLGAGGMGAVYEARQDPLNRRVALKILHAQGVENQELVDRFFNEARVLSFLEHPSLVQVSDFGHAVDGTAYLVMEYLRGQSLGQRLGSGDGRLPVVAALQLSWQVAEVLAMAHAQGIVHRDLKPDNLMLVADPIAPGGERVKVLDFGIAKLLNETQRDGTRTDTQAVMGTPMYMSPEQCAGAGGVDGKSDVYSLGCVLYRILGGRPPFVAEGVGQLIGMHLYEEPPELDSVAPPSVIEFVYRLLVKDKGLRPSMSETVAGLGYLLATLSGAGPAEPPRASLADRSSPTSMLTQRQPTTLGQSLGQQNARRSGWRQLLLVVATGFVLITISVIAQRTPRPPGHPSAPGAPAALAAGRPPEFLARPGERPTTLAPKVRWEVNTIPPGAAVIDEQENLLGHTPWMQESLARAGTVKLLLRSDGYLEQALEFDAASAVNRQLRLTRLPLPKSSRAKQASAASNRPALTNQPEITYED